MWILKHIICFFCFFFFFILSGHRQDLTVSKLFSDKLRHVTYLPLLKTLCYLVGMKNCTNNWPGKAIISCSSAWFSLHGAQEMYCLVLSAVYRKAKNESWDREKNIYRPCPHAHGQETGISPTAIQASTTLLCILPREEKSPFEVKCFLSPGLLSRRSGHTFTASDSISLSWRKSLFPEQADVLSSSSRTWFPLGSHLEWLGIPLNLPEWHSQQCQTSWV